MDDDELIRRFAEHAVSERGGGIWDVPPPASKDEIAATQSATGLVIPGLFSRILAEAADGGIGPGGGAPHVATLFGTRESAQDDRASILQAIERSRSLCDQWPPDLLPICTWGNDGGAAMTCVDCADKHHTVVTVVRWIEITRTHWNLRAWLEEWITGTITVESSFKFEQAAAKNPFSGKSSMKWFRSAKS